MVGRDRPKEALLRGLDAALAGTPSFAAVTGEPGIGKTRLVAECRAMRRPTGPPWCGPSARAMTARRRYGRGGRS